MKKIIFKVFGVIIALICIVTCTKITPDIKTINTKIEYVEPTYISTKASRDWTTPVDGKYDVLYYYIRIDGNIPGEDEVNLPAKDYFPQTSKRKSMMTSLNMGSVLSYVDWKSCNKFPMYIYSKDGSSVESIIVKQPTLEDLVNADKRPDNDFTGYLDHKDELHFIWYICKRQDGDKCWHIDGILTSKDRTNIKETIYGDEIEKSYKDMTPDEGSVIRTDNVEFDVHQQRHKDWKEIKTSIHIRSVVDARIILPIPFEFQAPADDVVVRSGVEYEYITKTINIGGKDFTFDFDIEHTEEGIVIAVNAKDNEDAIDIAKELYNDGVTFEIHTYTKNSLSDELLWYYLKQTKCLETSKTGDFTDVQACNVKGQITSAFFEDRIDFNENGK